MNAQLKKITQEMFSGRERYTKCVYNIIDEVQDTRNNKKKHAKFFLNFRNFISPIFL